MSVHDDVRAEIEAFAAASKAAMARNDLDAVLATMTEDVVLLSAAGPPVVGREAVRQVYSAMIEKFTMQNTASSSDFTVDAIGNVAVVVGKDSATLTPVGGGPTMMVSGPAVSVFRREDGTWKLARSLNLMAPAKQAASGGG
jgi:uncharacterized protein (TIGR02246 family)